MTKIKRYFGKPYNVQQNLFFENYMDSVAKVKKKILAYKSEGLISRSEASRKYGLNKEHFELERVRAAAYIATERGQTGLYFDSSVIKEVSKQIVTNKIPAGMIDEKTIIRSFKLKDLPVGFPHDFRQFGKYGQQEGRQGKPTTFYTEEVLEDHLKVKLIHPGVDMIPANSVPFEMDEEPFFGLEMHSGGLYSKMDTYYFGDVARMIKQRLALGSYGEEQHSDQAGDGGKQHLPGLVLSGGADQGAGRDHLLELLEGGSTDQLRKRPEDCGTDQLRELPEDLGTDQPGELPEGCGTDQLEDLPERNYTN